MTACRGLSDGPPSVHGNGARFDLRWAPAAPTRPSPVARSDAPAALRHPRAVGHVQDHGHGWVFWLIPRWHPPAQGAGAPKTRAPGSAAVVEGHLVAVGVRERESAAERPVDGG